MSRNSRTDGSSGFTLIEMLVIAPIALLVITGFIALMVNMVGSVMLSHGRNEMTHDIQGAVGMIERDVNLSTQFLDTTGTLPSPQGKNGATSAFTSTSGDLILGQIGTDKNIADPDREFVYYNTPYSCSDQVNRHKNRIFFNTIIYFVNNGSLWRRTFVPAPSGTLCSQPWQVNTCTPGYLSTATQCKANDTEVMKNISTFTVSYYAAPEDTTALTAANAPSASTISVLINGQRTVSGRSFTSTATVRSTKLSEKDIRLAPPGTPTVTAQAYNPAEPGTGTFTWTADPLVNYTVRYNINGGPWVIAAENTKQSYIKVNANRTETITVQVAARNTTGTSSFGSGASLSMPAWESCPLLNQWVVYDTWHAQCGFTKTSIGVITIKGLVRSGSTAADIPLFRLPIGYRPSHRLIFQTLINGATSRIDIETDGDVLLVGGGNNAWLSLNGISFLPNESLYTWTAPGLQNGWTTWGSPYSPLQSTRDASGRVHVQGLIRQGTFADRTPIAQLPSGSDPGQYLHLPARADGYNFVGLTTGGVVNAKGTSSSYYSVQMMYYPSSHTGWQNFTTVAGTPADGQLGSGWTWYGGEYATPQYTKSTDGIVSIKGLLSPAAGAGTPIAKLPPGYRPANRSVFGMASGLGQTRIDVDADGYIRAQDSPSYWVALDGIYFIAEQ